MHSNSGNEKAFSLLLVLTLSLLSSSLALSVLDEALLTPTTAMCMAADYAVVYACHSRSGRGLVFLPSAAGIKCQQLTNHQLTRLSDNCHWTNYIANRATKVMRTLYPQDPDLAFDHVPVSSIASFPITCKTYRGGKLCSYGTEPALKVWLAHVMGWEDSSYGMSLRDRVTVFHDNVDVTDHIYNVEPRQAVLLECLSGYGSSEGFSLLRDEFTRIYLGPVMGPGYSGTLVLCLNGTSLVGDMEQPVASVFVYYGSGPVRGSGRYFYVEDRPVGSDFVAAYRTYSDPLG